MKITAKMVKELREKTGAGMMDCKKALQESGGDEEKALAWLREKGISKAQKRAGKTASEGMIGSYIHMNGKIGVLVEINCETDFVAKSDKFQEFAKNVAMQIAASNPLYVSSEDVPEDVLEKEKQIYTNQAKEEGKPENIIPRIVEGKLKKFYKEVCLLEQPYIRDDSLSIQDLLNELVSVLGEKIVIRRFVRFEVGEKLD
ncbi:translation elongation factor Ts [Desulfothermus okinawensis JCM 13304]